MNFLREQLLEVALHLLVFAIASDHQLWLSQGLMDSRNHGILLAHL